VRFHHSLIVCFAALRGSLSTVLSELASTPQIATEMVRQVGQQLEALLQSLSSGQSTETHALLFESIARQATAIHRSFTAQHYDPSNGTLIQLTQGLLHLLLSFTTNVRFLSFTFLFLVTDHRKGRRIIAISNDVFAWIYSVFAIGCDSFGSVYGESGVFTYFWCRR